MNCAATLIVVGFALLTVPLLAEGKGHSKHPPDHADWAEKAAHGYEEKARRARKEGKSDVAEIYQRMAEIKREAGRASKRGEKFSWDEYHKLEGQLQHIHKQPDKSKPDKSKEQPGEGFLRTAEQYRKQAALAREQGDSDKARIYLQLAERKEAAAAAAKQGHGYDWSEYHRLKKKLHGDEGKQEKQPGHEVKQPDKPAAAELNIE